MEELDFGRLRIAVEESKHKLRVAADGENLHVTREAPVDARHDFEAICRNRFPNAHNDHHVLQVLLNPVDKMGRPIELSWEKLLATLEMTQRLWYSDKRMYRVMCQSAGKEGQPDECFGKDSNVRRGTSGKQQKLGSRFPSVGVAINNYFAVILSQTRKKVSLDNPDLVDTSGELLFMNLLKYRDDASWKRSGIFIEECKVAYIDGSLLYLIDGDNLTVVSTEIDTGKRLSHEVRRVDVKAAHNLTLGNNALSITANSEYVLITGRVFGWILFSVADLSLLAACPAGQSPGCKTVGVLSGHGFLLGTNGRFVETWQINPSEKNVVLVKSENWLISRPSSVTGDMIFLADDKDLEISHLHYTPGRIGVYTGHNIIELQMRPDPVMAQYGWSQDPRQLRSPVISTSVFGDMVALLHRSGVMEVRQFASGQTIQANAGAMLSFGERPNLSQLPSKQWITMSHETVACLSPEGHIWFWYVTDRIEKRVKDKR
jgi:hypothetical protein